MTTQSIYGSSQTTFHFEAFLKKKEWNVKCSDVSGKEKHLIDFFPLCPTMFSLSVITLSS